MCEFSGCVRSLLLKTIRLCNIFQKIPFVRVSGGGVVGGGCEGYPLHNFNAEQHTWSSQPSSWGEFWHDSSRIWNLDLYTTDLFFFLVWAESTLHTHASWTIRVNLCTGKLPYKTSSWEILRTLVRPSPERIQIELFRLFILIDVWIMYDVDHLYCAPSFVFRKQKLTNALFFFSPLRFLTPSDKWFTHREDGRDF